jgi:predicted methyltransferase
MRYGRTILAAAGAFLLASAALAQQVPANVTAAIADSARPEADKARDAERKAAQILALTGVKQGDRVADIFPGGGYYTRLFAKAVGPKGHVTMVIPDTAARGADAAKALAAQYPNVSVVVTKIGDWKPEQKQDVIFNSQFYHDLLNPRYGGGADIATLNKVMFDALKPGGAYFIIDHSSAAGTGIADIGTIHRIDEAAAAQQLTAAGFTVGAKSDLLRNPADDRKKNVFDPTIRGKTDQFVLKMVKPR